MMFFFLISARNLRWPPWLKPVLLDCYHDGQQRRRGILAAPSRRRLLVRSSTATLVCSCSLDHRLEFGLKNKNSWLSLRAGGCVAHEEAAPAPEDMEMKPSTEDYTCVISRGPNPRTVYIFGDMVAEGGRAWRQRFLGLELAT